MTSQSQNGIRQQAELLARENRKADPAIEKVFWFPHANEVRLIETSPEVPCNVEPEIQAFYFAPSPTDDLPAPSAIALIRPEEAKNLQLPAGWGRWDDAVEL